MRHLPSTLLLAFALIAIGPIMPAQALVTPSDDLTTGLQVEDPENSGDFLFSNGNDTAPEADNAVFVSFVVGETVHELGRTPTSALLQLDPVATKDDTDGGELLTAVWTWNGPGTVGYIVVKAGGEWALFDYTSSTSPANTGIVSVACLFYPAYVGTGCQDQSWSQILTTIGGSEDALNRYNAISHVTAYTPLPAAAWLFMTALAGLFGIGFTRRRAN